MTATPITAHPDFERQEYRRFPIPDWWTLQTPEETYRRIAFLYSSGIFKDPEPVTEEERDAWLHETDDQRAARVVRETGAALEREYYRRTR